MKIFSVLNLSTESRQQDTVVTEPKAVVEAIQRLLANGADYVDIGARSTSRRAPIIADSIEQQRFAPVMQEICKQHLKAISLDTWSIDSIINYHQHVDIINYTSTYFPENLLKILASSRVKLVVNYLAAHNPYALRKTPYVAFDAKHMLDYFSQTLDFLAKNGVEVLAIDPNLGMWHPHVQPDETAMIQAKIIETIPQLKTLAPVFIITPRISTTQNSWGCLNVNLTQRILNQGVDYIRTHDLAKIKALIASLHT